MSDVKAKVEFARVEFQDWRAYIAVESDTDHELVLETDVWEDGKIRTERLSVPIFRMKPLAEILRLMIDIYYH